jgi:uncharacterized membrane protein
MTQGSAPLVAGRSVQAQAQQSAGWRVAGMALR